VSTVTLSIPIINTNSSINFDDKDLKCVLSEILLSVDTNDDEEFDCTSCLSSLRKCCVELTELFDIIIAVKFFNGRNLDKVLLIRLKYKWEKLIRSIKENPMISSLYILELIQAVWLHIIGCNAC
jgi:hypothetical protein